MRASRSTWYRWAVGSSKVSLSRGIAFWVQDFEQVATVPASLLALGFDTHSGAVFLFMQVQCQTEHHRQVGETPAADWSPYRRRPRRHPTHRCPAPPSGPRLRNRGAGRRSGPLRRGPGGGALYNRGPLQDRRGGCRAVVAITPAAMNALDAIRPAWEVRSECSGFRCRKSPGPRVWRTGSTSAGTAGASAWPGAWPRTAPPPTR